MLNKRFTPFFVALFIFFADQLSKYLTNAYLPQMNHNALWYPYGGIGIFKDFFGIEFSISHQINYGAAWGAFADYQVPLLYLRITLILGLVFYTCFINKQSSWQIPLAMIIAGALGNVTDYFVYGHVVDMLHYVFWGYDFPVFNIADSAIFVGIATLLIVSNFDEKPSVKKTVTKKTPPKKKTLK